MKKPPAWTDPYKGLFRGDTIIIANPTKMSSSQIWKTKKVKMEGPQTLDHHLDQIATGFTKFAKDQKLSF